MVYVLALADVSRITPPHLAADFFPILLAGTSLRLAHLLHDFEFLPPKMSETVVIFP